MQLRTREFLQQTVGVLRDTIHHFPPVSSASTPLMRQGAQVLHQERKTPCRCLIAADSLDDGIAPISQMAAEPDIPAQCPVLPGPHFHSDGAT